MPKSTKSTHKTKPNPNVEIIEGVEATQIDDQTMTMEVNLGDPEECKKHIQAVTNLYNKLVGDYKDSLIRNRKVQQVLIMKTLEILEFVEEKNITHEFDDYKKHIVDLMHC